MKLNKNSKSLFQQKAIILLCSVGLFLCVQSTFFAAYGASPTNLGANLTKEQAKATERMKSLERLTETERKLNKNLVEAEKRILTIEKDIEEYQKKLSSLAGSDAEEQKKYEALLAEQKKTEQGLTDNLTLLWEIAGRQISVGKREMLDWDAVDREQTWALSVYDSLEKYRRELDKQEKDLAEVVGRRDTISAEFGEYLKKVDKEKASLLTARLSYSKELASVRQSKKTTEDELETILALVKNLELQMQHQPQKISSLKGQIPWPVKGKIERRFNAKANPPYNGIGIRTAKNALVQAVASGIVVHNDVMRGLGQVVVLQHDEEYYTIYAYLQESSLPVGKAVVSAEKIGTSVIYYPDLGGPGIFFALRSGQKAINPQDWLRSQ